MKIEVTVRPQAHANSVEKTSSGYVVSTTAPARDGRANEATIQLLAEYFGIAPSHISIVRGHATRKKLVEIR